MPLEDDTALAKQEQVDFASGFSDKPSDKPAKTAKPEPAAPEKAPAEAEDKPEFVQVTAKELTELRAAAAKIPSYDHQLSKLHGTTGNLQKLLNDMRAASQPATPAARSIELPKEALANMKSDFPELAEKFEAILSGAKVVGEVDADKLEALIAKYINERDAKREIEALQETYPDWKVIVSHPDAADGKPDPDSPYRRWLATKDPEYQKRLNETESAAVVQRSIALFRRETRAAPKPTPAPPAQRTDRFRAAVQPKGDGAAAPAGRSDNDEFEAGFAQARG